MYNVSYAKAYSPEGNVISFDSRVEAMGFFYSLVKHAEGSGLIYAFVCNKNGDVLGKF